ncbi:MAG: YjbE family putative metal transport protein [Pelagibacteraceae bacterium]|nr:YjbE family putative metal transport protein [Pelagibacteraceae bacterium]MBO6485177.1 YjbE family putative metal transport protein [Pelagibacteraceae bacterium]MBO6487820.1 YjbE family putative metal transport protein [Pelagibacteraceae bacterium]
MSFEQVTIFFQIVFIDILMAADNAIIIGLIAASFAKADRQRIIMFGVFAAFIFRVIFALITVQLLQYPILKIIGGALLIWIILKLLHDLQLLDVFKTSKQKIVKPKKQPSFIGGVYAVLIADVTLSFDNVLGVAAASREHTYLLIFGLLLSVFLIATVATFFAEYIKKHSWVGIVGLVVILLVALQLIGGGIESQYPGTIPEPFKSWL